MSNINVDMKKLDSSYSGDELNDTDELDKNQSINGISDKNIPVGNNLGRKKPANQITPKSRNNKYDGFKFDNKSVMHTKESIKDVMTNQ